jgi:hypothetical protein
MYENILKEKKFPILNKKSGFNLFIEKFYFNLFLIVQIKIYYYPFI